MPQHWIICEAEVLTWLSHLQCLRVTLSSPTAVLFASFPHVSRLQVSPCQFSPCFQIAGLSMSLSVNLRLSVKHFLSLSLLASTISRSMFLVRRSQKTTHRPRYIYIYTYICIYIKYIWLHTNIDRLAASSATPPHTIWHF